MKEFVTTVGKEDSSLSWNYRIYVPMEIAKDFLSQENKRVICTVNEKLTLHCALMSDGQGGYFIMLNKEKRKKLGLTTGSPVHVILQVDTSEYGMPMPAELEEVMASDPEGHTHFHKLTPGKQRSLLHLIGKIKSTDIKITKSLILMAHLKLRDGGLDFRALNEDFKHKNY